MKPAEVLGEVTLRREGDYFYLQIRDEGADWPIAQLDPASHAGKLALAWTQRKHRALEAERNRAAFWRGFNDGLSAGPVVRWARWKLWRIQFDWKWFSRDVANAYRVERRQGRNPLAAVARAVHFAATCPF